MIGETHFKLPGTVSLYRGKVRDVYTLSRRKGPDLIVLIATDRISAFDIILPSLIPYKGQVLNELASWFLQRSARIVPNWLLNTPDPNVSIGFRCKPIELEFVVRGYLAGHAWRCYRQGERSLCGVPLPEGLKENDALPRPILTPSTKALSGHDQDISKDAILSRGLLTQDQLSRIESFSNELFAFGTREALEKGLILVDTKYEFGVLAGEIRLMDEIHTPDSSRYFYRNTYDELQEKGLPQRQLSKEFVREWLLSEGFSGTGQAAPLITEKKAEEISLRYIELYEKLLGKSFSPRRSAKSEEVIEEKILSFLQKDHLNMTDYN